jgi:hypothetical protein
MNEFSHVSRTWGSASARVSGACGVNSSASKGSCYVTTGVLHRKSDVSNPVSDNSCTSLGQGRPPDGLRIGFRTVNMFVSPAMDGLYGKPIGALD